MPLAAGTRLGPYELQSALGAGGMGEVYKARDTRLDRTVAVKVLPQDLAADPERRLRFEREARAVAALSHPHICVVHDVGRDGDVDYLVMEYSRGRDARRTPRADEGPASPRADAAHRRRGCRCPRQGPSRRHRPPRPQAGQHHPDQGGGEAARLRPRQAAGALRRERSVDRHQDRPARHGHRHHSRHRALHGAGAGRRARGGYAQRYLGAGRRPLRDGGRGAAIRRRRGGQRDRRHPEGHTRAAGVAAAAHPSGARSSRRTLPRQGPGRALAERRRRETRAGLGGSGAFGHGHPGVIHRVAPTLDALVAGRGRRTGDRRARRRVGGRAGITGLCRQWNAAPRRPAP